MGTHRNRLLRLVAVAATAAGLTVGTQSGIAAAGPKGSAKAGGTPSSDVSARDDHRPAGAGSGRKIGR
jgi:hypothetical protein